MDSPRGPDLLKIGDKTFTSRLIVGTGKYASHEETVAAIRASGAEMVTVAVRRVDLDATNEESLLAHLFSCFPIRQDVIRWMTPCATHNLAVLQGFLIG